MQVNNITNNAYAFTGLKISKDAVKHIASSVKTADEWKVIDKSITKLKNSAYRDFEFEMSNTKSLGCYVRNSGEDTIQTGLSEGGSQTIAIIFDKCAKIADWAEEHLSVTQYTDKFLNMFSK